MHVLPGFVAEFVNVLELKPLTEALLPQAVALDRLSLGGLWSLDGYQRELESPNSDLLVLQLRDEEQGGLRDGEPGGRESEISEIKESGARIQNLFKSSPSVLSSSFLPLVALGCSWAIADEAHITVLAVHPDYRQQGLGQTILHALLTLAWQRGLKWATLEVRASNQAAIALYQKFGFQEAGKRKRYYQDTGEDALVLWRSGLQHPDFAVTLEEWHQEIDDRLHQMGWHVLRAE